MTNLNLESATQVNPDDLEELFWDKNFLIALTFAGFQYLVNAEHRQAAIDTLIDWLEENEIGLLLTPEEETEYSDELEVYLHGGNHGRYINTLNYSIKEIDAAEIEYANLEKHEIEAAFPDSVEGQTIVERGKLEVFKEHGKWWVKVEDLHFDCEESESLRTFSVELSTNGFDFEEV